MINLSSRLFDALYEPFFDRYLWYQFPGLPFTFRDASFNIVDGSDQLEGAKGYSLVFVVDFHPNLHS